MPSKRSDRHRTPVSPCTVADARKIWHGMRRRCFNPEGSKFENYGGRGITVCDRWLTFENFLADMGTRPTADHSIDRIDVNGNYEPANCRWLPKREQPRNQTRSVHMTVGGRTMLMIDWASETGIPVNTICQRLQRGWTPERAVSVQPDTRRGRHPRATNYRGRDAA